VKSDTGIDFSSWFGDEPRRFRSGKYGKFERFFYRREEQLVRTFE
jgi:hypothetical protein